MYYSKYLNKVEIKNYESTDNFLKECHNIQCNIMWIDIDYCSNSKEDDFKDIINKFFDYSNSSIARELPARHSSVEKYSDFYSIDMLILKDSNLKKHMHWLKKHFIINKNIIISLGSEHSKIFEEIWKNLSTHPTALKGNTDGILYLILDYICDEYFAALEDLESMVEEIEVALIDGNTNELQDKILKLRKEILKFKRVVSSLRTVTYSLISYDYDVIDEENTNYIKTVHDNTFKIYEALESELDTLATDLNLYNSKMSNKMNETMEFLTVITTIMAPLTLIAGIYGMNFKFMPEIESKFAYPITLVVMLILVILQVRYFKKKNWL